MLEFAAGQSISLLLFHSLRYALPEASLSSTPRILDGAGVVLVVFELQPLDIVPLVLVRTIEDLTFADIQLHLDLALSKSYNE